MTDLTNLIARVEGLTGPDRNVDLALAQHLVPDVIVLQYDTDLHINIPYTHFEYTRLIDDAVALVGRIFQDARWEVATTGWRAGATVASYERSVRVGAYAATPAIALILATLRALQGKADES